MLMTAQTIAKLLRGFLNSNQLTLSDIRKGMVVLSNGKLGDGKVRGEAQKPVSSQPRKPNAERSVFKVLAGSAC